MPLLRLARPPAAPEPLRGEDWHRAARVAFRADDALTRMLLHRRMAGDPARLPGLILASAILRGLLLRPDAWPVLLQRLMRRDLSLRRAAELPPLPWIDLHPPGARPAGSNRPEGGKDLRFYPDVVTLSLLRRWQKARHMALPPVITPEEALVVLAAALGLKDDLAGIAPGEFARGAMAPLEDRAPRPLPFALKAFATGGLVAFSQPAAEWEAFWMGARKREDDESETPTTGSTSSVRCWRACC